MIDTNVASKNTGLKERTTWFALSAIVKLYGLLHLDFFQEPRVIYLGVDAHIKLVPNSSKFFVKSVAPEQGKQQEKFNVLIEKVALNISTKELISDAALAHNAFSNRRNPF